VLNGVAGWLIARLLGPFASWPPMVGLTVVSLITTVALLVAFKWTSNQRALAETKRQVHAGLFELRLFQDDPRLMLRAAGGLLAQQARYLRYAFVPLLWIGLPLSILFAHLQTYYGYDTLRPGQQATVIVHARAAAAEALTTSTSTPASLLTLTAPAGVRVETPCVWVPSLQEGAWRIAIDGEGDYDLRISWDAPTSTRTPAASTFTKRLRVTEAIVPHPPISPAASLWDEWLHPGEPPLPPDAPIDAIRITYPTRFIPIAGLACPWWALFFALTTVFILFGRSWLRITI